MPTRSNDGRIPFVAKKIDELRPQVVKAFALFAAALMVLVVIQVAQAFGGEQAIPIPSDFDEIVDWGFEISSLVIAFGLLAAATTRGWKTVGSAVVTMFLAFFSFTLLSLSDAAAIFKNFEFAVFADFLAAVVAVEGSIHGYPTDILPEYSPLDPIASSLDIAAIFMSVSSLGADIASLRGEP